MVFIDFEYAGRDDPAKLICDFFCQPDIPLDRAYHDQFLDGVLHGLGASDATYRRCQVLLDAYRIKWICIMLNEFLPAGASRRQFAAATGWPETCARQLHKAAAALDEIGR